MGFIEEGRQLIQDFVTPEIRSIDARLTAVEKKLDSVEARSEKRFDAMEGKIDRVQMSLEGQLEKTQSGLAAKIESTHAELTGKIDKNSAQAERGLESVRAKLEALDAKYDKNQAQIMDSLHQWGNIAQILERLARVESKLQNVA